MKQLSRVWVYALIMLVGALVFIRSDVLARPQNNAGISALGDFNNRNMTIHQADVNAVAPTAPSDWGSVSVGQDANGRYYAMLENSQLRARYSGYVNTAGQVETSIVDLVIKSGGLNEDQIGDQPNEYSDACATRGEMTSATVKYDNQYRKTVRLEWDYGAKVEEVSIFPDSTYLKMDYYNYGVNIVDLGSPGGISGTFQFHGGDTWLRGYVLYPDHYYDRYPPDGINDPATGVSLTLNYNGYFIGGVSNPSNHRGFARVLPVSAISIINLLFNRGFEWFPYYEETHQWFTSYLYVVTGGSNEILTVGRQLADQLNTETWTLTTPIYGNGTVTKSPDQPNYNTGQVVTLTATAAPGWLFTNWGGDIHETVNPVQVTIIDETTVSARFFEIFYDLTVNVKGSGTVTKDPDQTSFHPGDVVTVTAVPEAGGSFLGWSGALNSSAPVATLTMDTDKAITATFSVVNHPPVLDPLGDKTAVSRVPLNFIVGAHDPDGTTPNLSASRLPGTASFSDNGNGTGLFTWTPTLADVGVHTTTLAASDGFLTDTKTISISVNETAPMVPANWWNETWHFRLPIEIRANGFERFAKVAESAVNLTQYLATLGRSGTVDLNSLRVVEVNDQGVVVDSAVDFQFDRAADFDATTNAKGNLVLLLKGTTAANAVRYYYLYFDTAGHGPFTPLTFTPQVTVTDNISRAGQLSFRIQMQNATYYYHKQGAAFANMQDADGIDWISYDSTPGSGASGEYRGIPNISDNMAHPGGLGATSVLTSQGPLKAIIYSESTDHKWAFTWELYPTSARMTLLKRDPSSNYWILYEGTPYGALNVGRDYFVISDGVKRYVGDSFVKTWNGPIPAPEWVYFGDDTTNRVLFMAHHQADNLIDTFWQMQGKMTVFGFGRDGYDACSPCSPKMSLVPAQFTIGFAEDHVTAPEMLNSAYRDLVVTVGPPEAINHAPVLSVIGDKSAASGFPLSFTLHASDPDGITPTLSARNLPSGATLLDKGNGTADFSWTPTRAQVGVYTVNFVASDGALIDTEAITITVNAHYVFLPLIVRGQ